MNILKIFKIKKQKSKNEKEDFSEELKNRIKKTYPPKKMENKRGEVHPNSSKMV